MNNLINKITAGNCVELMKQLPDASVDMCITSPPYDNLRTYKGYSFPFEEIAAELFRVIKEGGVVVWVVNDATINGTETGTSFRQALKFKEIGFNIHDTMIFLKSNPIPQIYRKRYTNGKTAQKDEHHLQGGRQRKRKGTGKACREWR